MKKGLMLIFCSFLFGILFAAPSAISAPKYASIVVEGNSGKILHTANADTQTFPASLTKMMTLYMLFEALDSGKIKIKQTLPVSRKASRQIPAKLYVQKGDRISVRDAILALMVKSANDVAVVVAEALGGSEANFARKMTHKARELGMYNTVFKNASGVPNKYQKSTARDMATLSRALYNHFPGYYKYFKTKEFTFRGIKYHSFNKLLGKVQGVDGIKTGYINASGFNLASSAIRSGNRLFGVVMGGKSSKWRDRHMTQLLNSAFAKIRAEGRFIPTPTNRPHNIIPRSKPQRKSLSL